MQLLKYMHQLQSRKLESVTDVKRVLAELDQILKPSELSSLYHFNHAYLAITQAVETKLESKNFAYEDFLHRFDVCFAWYYLDALYAYLMNQPVPQAWQAAFDYSKLSDAKPIRVLALGVNAHVNNDIPQVLVDCAVDHSHNGDYYFVNRVIDQTVPQVLTDLNIVRQWQKLYYKLGMYLLIRIWRRNSWIKAHRLKRQVLNVKQVEKRAGQISQGAQLFI